VYYHGYTAKARKGDGCLADVRGVMSLLGVLVRRTAKTASPGAPTLHMSSPSVLARHTAKVLPSTTLGRHTTIIEGPRATTLP
jgi:hypothetical protein